VNHIIYIGIFKVQVRVFNVDGKALKFPIANMMARGGFGFILEGMFEGREIIIKRQPYKGHN
jgi:hypothetical protein